MTVKRLFLWRWLRRRERAAETRVRAAERAAAAAHDRWGEVNDLSDRLADAAARALRRPPRPPQRPGL